MLAKCVFLPHREHLCTAPIGAFAGTNRSSWYHEALSRSPTALQVQTLVLHAGVDVITVGESVAVDERDSAAGGVTNAAYFVASAQESGADVGDSNRLAAAAAATGHPPRGPTADVLAADRHPREPTAAAVQLPRRGSHRHPSVDSYISRRDLAKTTNGKCMRVARRRRRRRRRHLRFLRLLYFAVGIPYTNGMIYQCWCDVGRGEERALLDIVVIQQLTDNYLNNLPVRFLDADNLHGVDELIYSCQEYFWVFAREHLNGL